MVYSYAWRYYIPNQRLYRYTHQLTNAPIIVHMYAQQ